MYVLFHMGYHDFGILFKASYYCFLTIVQLYDLMKQN